MSREVFGRMNNNPTTSQSLLVEVKIKNKVSKNILIEDCSDWTAIDQQIKWFLTTSNLKEKAFSYIKTTIANRIKANSVHSNSTHSIEPPSPENKENYPKMKVKTSLKIEKHPNIRTVEPCCISININNNKTSCLEDNQDSYREDIDINERSNHNRESFVFSSSFTLPSSVGDKERTLLTDMKFEDAFDTVGKHSQDFSSINEITKDRPLLSARPLLFSPSLPNPSCPVSKRPVKITLFKKSRDKEGQTECGISKMVHRTGESLRDSNQFRIYEKEERNLQKEFEEKSEFDERLRMLFKKLTQHNPECLKEVHSQYVSYEELNRAELRVMGTFFERIDHKELSNLGFSRFRRNVLELCQEELPSLMSSRCGLPFRI